MVTAENLKKEVNEIKARVKPEPKHFIMAQVFGSPDQPHGFLYGSLFHIVIGKDGKETKWYEALDAETELRTNRAYYDSIISKPTNKFMKEPTHPFNSFESFLEYSRCKCGKHGLDGKQPYHGETLCQH
jgi:hypothetical protein